MHPELIKAHMRMKGVTPSVLADQLGRSRSCITQVIAAKTKTPEIQQAIANVIGLPVSEIWPGQVRLRREKGAHHE
ncbi:MAG: helix-turn-helix domain-containing protein [Azoarcus sp.]|jgi:lambda repressor-like predicted transcriptional regulator|nr:helix-turn-helix domain-containing protein [Azoarcus sp.]